MKPEDVIRFGQLRELIDSGKKLTESQQIEYYTLLPQVRSDIPSTPTQIMQQLVRNEEVKAVAKTIGQKILENLPSIFMFLKRVLQRR